MDQSDGVCFRGSKTRPVNCLDQSGNLSMSSCPKSTKPIFKMACFIKEIFRNFKSRQNINRKILHGNLSKTKKCARNCELSSWSEWLSCTCDGIRAVEQRKIWINIAYFHTKYVEFCIFLFFYLLTLIHVFESASLRFSRARKPVSAQKT